MQLIHTVRVVKVGARFPVRFRNVRARYVHQILVALAVYQLLFENTGGLTRWLLWRRFIVLKLLASRAAYDCARKTARVYAVECWSCFQNLVNFL